MRVIGIPQIPIVRYSTAEFTPPVPMGSPQNYYGVGILNVPTTSQLTHNDDTDWRNTNDTPNNSGNWTSTNDVDDNDGQYGFSTTANNSSQQWWNFGLQGGNGGLPNDNTLAILGLEVRLRDRLYNQGSNLGSSANCRLQVEVSTNGGQSWGGPVPPNPRRRRPHHSAQALPIGSTRSGRPTAWPSGATRHGTEMGSATRTSGSA